VLFAVGTALESVALQRSRHSMDALQELAPAQACVVSGGHERTIAVEDVAPGMQFVVRPGERVALDGVVSSGASSVDQSPITGESVAVDKQTGDSVFAGTLNTHGSLVVRATKVAGESTLSRVAALVEQAQGSRAPSERFTDRFARVYTPLVFAAASMLAVVPPLLFGGDTSTWVYRALALLIYRTLQRPEDIITWTRADIIEKREPDGSVRSDVVDAVVDAVGVGTTVFEAPGKDQQAWLVRRFGADVNLANIPPGDALGVEALRLGLRADTFDLHASRARTR